MVNVTTQSNDRGSEWLNGFLESVELVVANGKCDHSIQRQGWRMVKWFSGECRISDGEW